MDLQLYGQVLWRHRWLLALGLVVAFALAGLAVVRVEFNSFRPTFSYRQPEIWQASTRLMLTKGEDSRVFSDPSGLGPFASFYAELVATDAVQFEVLSQSSGIAGLAAAPVLDPISQAPGPFLDILGLAESPRAAARISDRGADVFTDYISTVQTTAGVPEKDRVVPLVVKRPLSLKGPQLVQARKKTTPAFVFLAVLTATFGLIFVVENARRNRKGPPRIPAEVEQADAEQEVSLRVHESRGVLSGRR